jgi:O-antigen biosynthesis protein
VRSLVPERDVVVLPNVHAARSTEVPGAAGRADLLFIGGYKHLPNVDAVRWFSDEILPLIRRQEPARFLALGSFPPPEIEELASATITVPGYLDDVSAHFDRARVFVAPLRYGAGMKGKIGMAMAMGLPVVTTSIGAEGMGLVDGTHVVVADDAHAFAEAVLRLYHDDALWASLSVEGHRLVAREWSPEAMTTRLTALMNRTRASGLMVPRTWGRLDPEGPFERPGH